MKIIIWDRKATNSSIERKNKTKQTQQTKKTQRSQNNLLPQKNLKNPKTKQTQPQNKTKKHPTNQEKPQNTCECAPVRGIPLTEAITLAGDCNNIFGVLSRDWSISSMGSSGLSLGVIEWSGFKKSKITFLFFLIHDQYSTVTIRNSWT